ncbi:MAG: DUF3006 domain-containing protein [Firmicutes bacterium]|nr:DUF3006 domain-containing protein [Bacillota bacterium]
MKLYTVDSITQGLARLLLREAEQVQHVVPVADLPKGTGEGDIIEAEIVDGQIVRALSKPDETLAQKQKIQAKLDKLKRKGKDRAD